MSAVSAPLALVLVAVLGASACGGCVGASDSGPAGTAAQAAAPQHQPAQFVEASFEELYPIFLQRKSMSQGEKSSLWNSYSGRWVRWEGVLASITGKGVTVKHLQTTSTYDVSLVCDASTMATLKARFAPGDRVRYTGRLKGYDDIFRTMYLQNGAIIEKVAHGDLGVIADLSRAAAPADLGTTADLAVPSMRP